MNVLHLISGGDSGGAKTHVHSLLAALTGAIDVTMVCFSDGPFAREAIEQGIRTLIVSARNPQKALAELKRLVKRERFDMIHSHGARGNLMALLLQRSTGLPAVTTVHSDYRVDYWGRPLARLTYGTINTLVLRLLDYRVCVSDAMTDLLITRGFDPDRLFTIYNGLDFTPTPAAMSRADYFQSLGLDAGDDSVVAGIAARLNPVKDIATLIRGFAKAYATCPQLRLLIAGEGEERARLTALAKELGVSDQVCFAGWITDTHTFYQAIDINVLTSLSETFPYALTEGARAGLATISSKVGGVPYLIDHGVNGLLFPPGDGDALAKHLMTLAGDPVLRAHLGARLRQKGITQYSLDTTIARQLEIYETVLRRAARRKAKRRGALVCGAYGRGNAGDDAILEAIVTELRDIDPDIPVWVLSRSPASTRLAYRVNAIYTFNFPRFLRRMGKTALYINGGGSLMQDVTSRRSLWYYLFNITAAKLRGNQVQMYGCGIGPIGYPSNRRLASGVIERHVDAITLRDTHSKQELDSMGITAPTVTLAADPTVILPPAPAEVIDGILESHGLDPNGNYICFTLRPWPGFEAKAAIFASAADYAWRQHGLTPIFLPIEARLDNDTAHMAAALIQDAPFHILEHTGSSAQTIGLFARMRVVVSMRLHALVFAAGQGVPLVGVVYDQKISSFLSYIGQDLYTELDALTLERLCAHIDAAAARIGDHDFLSGGVTRLRRAERQNSLTAARLLKEAGQ